MSSALSVISLWAGHNALRSRKDEALPSVFPSVDTAISLAGGRRTLARIVSKRGRMSAFGAGGLLAEHSPAIFLTHFVGDAFAREALSRQRRIRAVVAPAAPQTKAGNH
jgi:hypothetical protein